MAVDLPVPELARARTSERGTTWPDSVMIVAKWGKVSRSFPITRDMFFGLGSYGAPLTGDALIAHIDRLRKLRP